MGKAKILLIEGKRTSKRLSFAEPLQRRYMVVLATTGQHALEIVSKTLPDVIVLNAASMRTTGQRICNTLRARFPETPIIHILKAPSPGAKSPRRRKKSSGANSDVAVTLTLPFTARKLINRIERFIVDKNGKVLVAASIRLNLENRVLTTPNKEIRLTPKLTRLLELFIRHPNKVLERRFLMEQVWQTDYLGDTRTLDVHIRWIREAIEETPGKPTFLKTVRGKGYIFYLN